MYFMSKFFFKKGYIDRSWGDGFDSEGFVVQV